MTMSYEDYKRWLTAVGFRPDYDPNDRIIVQEYVVHKGKVYFVSTADLGLDHSYGGDKPLYYETMVFSEDREKSGYMDRYSTREEAIDKHNALIELMRTDGDIDLGFDTEDTYADI